MDIPAGQRTYGSRRRAAILGSATIPGSPEQVSGIRAFIARTLDCLPAVDSDAATLLTSELVTNAIQHTGSGAPGGTVTVVVIEVPGGVLIEVVDNGSAGTPVVKDDLYAAEGHGLFLVQQLAARWGYLRDPAGTTVWFHLATADHPDEPDRNQPDEVDRDQPDEPDRDQPDEPDRDQPDGYLLAAATIAAWSASNTPVHTSATSSSQVT